MATITHPNLVVCSSRALPGLFTMMRDVKSSSKEFSFFAKRAQRILAEEAIAELPSEEHDIQTPCGPFRGVRLVNSNSADNICAISIIRSGDALVDSVSELIPGICVGKILIQRNEDSKEKEAQYFYSKMPPNVKNMDILLCDPMLATGGSAKAAIDVLVRKYEVKTDRIVFANMISCPEGLKAMEEAYPEVKIVTACVDDCLNEEKYIVPGLGDYGDRFFNTA
mmetsp:Transcript_9138/g.11428  ORF Transcript_9138/g.11428 Transcript_9138/m.11428 type:complete len:224 (-) Transcript_9138:48-719(-)